MLLFFKKDKNTIYYATQVDVSLASVTYFPGVDFYSNEMNFNLFLVISHKKCTKRTKFKNLNKQMQYYSLNTQVV